MQELSSELIYAVPKVIAWLNINEGFISAALFVLAGIFGWVSGIFSALRRKPRFKIDLIDGPTFCCTYLIGKKFEGYEVHRTSIALYLNVANAGTASASIAGISVGYHWHLRPWGKLWWKYRLGWHWIHEQAVALQDFHVAIGSQIKVYPFLTQCNAMSPRESNTFLEVGRAVNGVIYFEQADSWGGCFPSPWKGHVKMKVRLYDTFGNHHTAKFFVPIVTLKEARKYNPAFGTTFAEMRGELISDDAGGPI